MVGRSPVLSPAQRTRLLVAIAVVAILGGLLLLRAVGRPTTHASPAAAGGIPGAVGRGSSGSSGSGSGGGAAVVPTPGPSPFGPPPARPAAVVTLHVPILTYHVVAPWSLGRAYSQRALDIDPALVRSQLTTLHDHGWRAITMAQLAILLATGTPAPPRTFVITVDDGYADGYTYLRPILESLGDVATFYVVPGRIGGPHEMTWDQVTSLAAEGMEIGDHTMFHRPLNLLPLATARSEIVDAQNALAARLGQPPITLAYPFGGIDPAVARIVDGAGLWLAATTRWGTSETWAGRLLLPRIHVSPSESAASLLALCESFG